MLRHFRNAHWAVLPSSLPSIIEYAQMVKSGAIEATEDSYEGLLTAGAPLSNQKNSEVSVIEIRGVLTPNYGFMGTTYASITRQTREAVASGVPILYAIDSPGGMVAGCDECANVIFEARSKVPVAAVARFQAASAAYFLGSQARTFSVSPTGEAGSIGTLFVHADVSALYEDVGINISVLTSSNATRKAEMSPFAPLSDDAIEETQRSLDRSERTFHEAIARGRDMTVANVRKVAGEGLMFDAADAKARGLVDKIETIESALSGMLEGRVTRQRRRSSRGDLAAGMFAEIGV